MAPPNFLSGAAFLKLYWSYQNELAMNIVGLQKLAGATFDQATAESLGSAIKARFTADLANNQAASTQLVRVGIRDWSTPNQPEYRDTGAAVPGIGVGDPLPRGTALVTTLRTAKAGKRFTGRLYLGGWVETGNDANAAQSVTIGAAAQLFWQHVNQDLVTEQLQMAVVSRPSEAVQIVKTVTHAPGSVPPTTETIISNQSARSGEVNLVVGFELRNNRWEYQRRRDNGRGSGSVASLMSSRIVGAL